MQDKSVIIKDFNLHYFLKASLLYFRQHLLFNDLLNIMRFINVTLTLLRDIITRNYYELRITINLLFITRETTNRLIYCD